MEEAKRHIYSVIFVAECENVKQWANNSKRNVLEIIPKIENSILFLYRTGRGIIPKEFEELYKDLGKCCEYRDFKAIPTTECEKTIAGWLKVHSDSNTYIYFLSNKDRMIAVEELFDVETADFDNHVNIRHAFTVYQKKSKNDKKFKDYNIRKENYQTKAESSIENQTDQTKKNHNEDTEKQNQTECKPEESKVNSGLMFNDFFSDDEDEKPEINTNKSTAKKSGSKKETDADDDFDPLDNIDIPKENIIHTSDAKENDTDSDHKQKPDREEDKTYNQKKQQSSQAGRKGGLGKKNKEPEPEDNRTLEEIEKEIFGDEKKYKQVEKVYTELDKSKMQTTDLYLERLINGIKKYCKKDADGNVNIEQNNFVEFIMILLKADNFDDFTKSWEVISSFDISLTEEEYTFIKEEAEYYAEVCNLFYGKDKW